MLGAEQAQQDLLPLARLGVQEVGELALGQHHALDEVLVRQAEQLLHGLVDAVQVLGHGDGLVAGLGRPRGSRSRSRLAARWLTWAPMRRSSRATT